jgi:hypothetical protein
MRKMKGSQTQHQAQYSFKKSSRQEGMITERYQLLTLAVSVFYIE